MLDFKKKQFISLFLFGFFSITLSVIYTLRAKPQFLWVCSILLLIFSIVLNTIFILQLIRSIGKQKRDQEEKIKQISSNLEENQKTLLEAQKLEAIGKLAGGIAHDFNNILGVVSGYANLLENRIPEDPKSLKYIRTIIEASNKGAKLIRDLLGFARRGKYESKTINLNELMTEAISLLCANYENKWNIEHLSPKALHPIQGDRSQLLQCFVHLINNAKEAMPQGGGIQLKSENIEKEIEGHIKNYVRISIIDEGLGITPEIQNKIFDPFFSTKSEALGAGLGLSMAHGIITNHGGEIYFESEINKGSTFFIILPAVLEEENNNLKQNQNLKELYLEKKYFIHKNVLLVDDDALLIECTREMLETAGMTVITAHSGKEAVNKIKGLQYKIDVVLLDMMMPEMDGIEVYQEIKKLNPNIKVIFISGYTHSEELIKLRQKENIQFIEKPIQQENLLKLIKETFSS